MVLGWAWVCPGFSSISSVMGTFFFPSPRLLRVILQPVSSSGSVGLAGQSHALVSLSCSSVVMACTRWAGASVLSACAFDSVAWHPESAASVPRKVTSLLAAAR